MPEPKKKVHGRIEQVKNAYHWRKHLRHDRKQESSEQEPTSETAAEVEKVKREKKP